MKFISLAIVAIVVAATVEASFPLHQAKNAIHNNKAHARMGQDITVSRCSSPNCTAGSCNPVVEFKGDQCHESPGIFKHGEILRCKAAPKKQCFRETLYNDMTNDKCTGNIVASAPRECDVCTEEFFSGKFFMYQGCGTNNFNVSHGCDYGCNNCDVTIPIQENVCVVHKGIIFKWAFMVSSPKACDADISADHFRDPFCDGQPDFKHSVFTGECYNMMGVGHMFSCA